MRTLLYRVTVCAILALLLVSAACAQYTEEDTSRLGIGFGVFFPTNSNVKDAVGSGWTGPTLMYNLKFDQQDRPKSYMSLGFFTKDGGSTGFEGSMLPLTYTMVKHFGEKKSTWYAGGGAGVYIGKFTPKFGGSSTSHDKVGVHVVGGREFGPSAFVELRYDFIPETGDNLTFTGLTTTVGLRQTF